MFSCTFKRGDRVLSNFVVSVKYKSNHCHGVYVKISRRKIKMCMQLTWQHACCPLLCGRHPQYFFSSSASCTTSSCPTGAPGLAGSPYSPLEPHGQRKYGRTQKKWPTCSEQMKMMTSHFPNGLPGVSSHYGKRDHSHVLAVF